MDQTTIFNDEYLLNAPLSELMAQADKIRAMHIGSYLDLCTIVNAKSGLCGEDCKFCAQSSRHSTEVKVYPLISKNEIKSAAIRAKQIGSKRFGIVTSGNRLTPQDLKTIIEATAEIVSEIDIAVCGSLGALQLSDLKLLKKSGMSRYHHNIETSPRYYAKIVTTHNFQERIDTIQAAKDSGMEVCSGGIVGMGETWQDRIDMARLLQKLNVDSVPVNFLMPIPGTPLESQPQISLNDALRTLCIFRLILQNKTIKIAAGREAILKSDQLKGFLSGANGMLIGGYLTVAGGCLSDDHQLIEKITSLWAGSKTF